MAREADEVGVDLIVYPELNLSSYAIDDLHLQEAQLDRVEAAIESIRGESAGLRPVLLLGASRVASGEPQ